MMTCTSSFIEAKITKKITVFKKMDKKVYSSILFLSFLVIGAQELHLTLGDSLVHFTSYKIHSLHSKIDP